MATRETENSGGTRAAILRAARLELSSRGYDGATIRGVARRAGVDPRLVRHYFRDKPTLIEEALRPSQSTERAVRRVLASDPDRAGQAIVGMMLQASGSDVGPAALVSAALNDAETAEQLAAWLSESGLATVVQTLGPDDHPLRTIALASQLLGLALLRDMVPTPPLDRVADDRLVAITAPVVQRLLTGHLMAAGNTAGETAGAEPAGGCRPAEPPRPRNPGCGTDGAFLDSS